MVELAVISAPEPIWLPSNTILKSQVGPNLKIISKHTMWRVRAYGVYTPSESWFPLIVLVVHTSCGVTAILERHLILPPTPRTPQSGNVEISAERFLQTP